MSPTFTVKITCPKCTKINSVSDQDFNHYLHCGHCNEVFKVPPSASSPGIILDDFLLVKEIGSGGMGVVYEATQLSLERPVALKILKGINSQKQIDELLREARIVARLNHPNIVQAYAAGYCGGICYFAMEYICGQTISEMLSDGAVFSEKKAIEICLKTAEALDFSWHKEHIVHRDIKPDNIMLTQEGEVKLMDLGLSILGNSEEEESDEVKGTIQYICPEQVRGEKTDLRSDFYSLGCTFYQMLTGKFIFEGKEQMHIIMQHLETPYEARPGDGLSSHVNATLSALCSKEQKNRPANAAELKLLLKPTKQSGRKKKVFNSNSQSFTPTTTNIRRQTPGIKAPAKKGNNHQTKIIIAVATLILCCLPLMFMGSKPKDTVPKTNKVVDTANNSKPTQGKKALAEKIVTKVAPPALIVTAPAAAKTLNVTPIQNMKVFKAITLANSFTQVNCSHVFQKGDYESIKGKKLTIDNSPRLHGELQFLLANALAKTASNYQWLLKMQLATKSTSGSTAEFSLLCEKKLLGTFHLQHRGESLKPGEEFYLLLPPLPDGIAKEFNLILKTERSDSAHFSCESPQKTAQLVCLDKGVQLESKEELIAKADFTCKASYCTQINSELKKEVKGCVQIDGTPNMPVELAFELSEEMIQNAKKYHWKLQFFIDDSGNAHTSGKISLLQNERKLRLFQCLDESGSRKSDCWHTVDIPLHMLKLEDSKLILKLINASSDGLYIRKEGEHTPKLTLHKKG